MVVKGHSDGPYEPDGARNYYRELAANKIEKISCSGPRVW